MLKVIFVSLVIGIAIVSCGSGTSSSTVSSAEDQCMDKYRWDTTAVNTSRLAVQIHYHNKGKGELAKHVSDRDAVKMVYCSGK